MAPVPPVIELKVFPKNKIKGLEAQDFQKIMDIDKICYPNTPITQEELSNILDRKLKGVICKVFLAKEELIGYHIYQMEDDRLTIIRLGVLVSERRKGYGSKMISEAYRKLTLKRNKICVTISEFADYAISFLRYNGFFATCVKRNACIDGSDGYCFRLVLKESIKS